MLEVIEHTSKTAKNHFELSIFSIRPYAHNIYDNHNKVVVNVQSSNMNVLRTTSNVVLRQNHIFNPLHKSPLFGVTLY